MKGLAVAAVTLALIGAAPRDAAAEETGLSPGVVAATIVGTAVGGAIGYYYFTGFTATAIGLVGGALVGDWWYTAIARSDAELSGKTKLNYADGPPPVFQLISHSGMSQLRLHPAAFSAAAD
jgi:hypothetical protein